MKIDANGNLIWNKTLSGEEDWYGSDLIQTKDGGYAFLASQYNSTADTQFALVIKTDAAGNTQWSKTYYTQSAENYTNVNTIIQVSDGYVIGGNTVTDNPATNQTEADSWLFKTDLNGTQLWSKTYAQQGDDGINFVSQTSDGGYMIAGDSEIYGNRTDITSIFLAKTDASGTYSGTKQMSCQAMTSQTMTLKMKTPR